MIGKYILDDQGKPVACDDLHEWARWMETPARLLAYDEVGSCRISTVFLGLDHGFGGGPPVLWETMAFGGSLDGYQERYATRQAAVEGHARTLAAAKGASN